MKMNGNVMDQLERVSLKEKLTSAYCVKKEES